MAVATVYVFDVAPLREPMGDAYTYMSEKVHHAVRALRDSIPEPPRP